MTPSASAIANARREFLGEEREPVLIIDNAVSAPRELVDIAANDTRFSDADGADNFYPGRLAPTPLAYVGDLARALDPLIREGFSLRGVAPGRASCNFSLATLPPERLALAQRIPHVDTVDPHQFAILHYLCDPKLGGTGFYRHRATGFEVLTPDRLEAYLSTLDGELTQTPPAAAYIGGDTAQFVRTRLVDAVFNRVIVYRSRVLHSGHIPLPEALSADPRRGRLTANIFLTYRQGA